MSQQLREAVNVPDALERNELVIRRRKIRDNASLNKNTIEHWNRIHPNEQPMETAFEDAVIAWCDGKGPVPELPKDGAE